MLVLFNLVKFINFEILHKNTSIFEFCFIDLPKYIKKGNLTTKLFGISTNNGTPFLMYDIVLISDLYDIVLFNFIYF